MKPLVIALSISTAAFAGSTVYFAGKLHDARSRATLEWPTSTGQTSEVTVVAASEKAGACADGDGARCARRTWPRSGAAADGLRVSAESPAPSAEVQPAAPPAMTYGDERYMQQQRRISAAFLRRYEDPTQRPEMLADEKAVVRRSTRGLAEAAGLSGEELDRLVDLLAEQRLERILADHRCRVDPSCDGLTYRFHDAEQHVAEVAALLGPEKHQKYRQFRLASTERSIVDQLRLRLVDGDALGSSDAERLISALWEERERFFTQAERRGVHLGIVRTAFSIVVTRTDERGMGNEVDHHTLEFNELASARAAAILTPAQLRVFKEIQDEAYRQIESSFRDQNAAKAEGAARAAPR